MVNRELKKKVSQSPLHRTDFGVIELVWQVIPHYEAFKKISILKVLLAKGYVITRQEPMESFAIPDKCYQNTLFHTNFTVMKFCEPIYFLVIGM